jgi:diguanylate cyclase (GGDEF)-like protein
MSFDPDDIWVDAIKGFNHVPQQKKRRLYRIAMVCAVGISYLIDTVLLFLFFLVGTIQIDAPLFYGMAGLFHVLLFSLLHWFGISERLQNRHMTIWQMAYAICVQLIGIKLAPQISPFFLGVMFIVFAFGTLRISFSEALAVWLVSTLAIAMAIFTKSANLTLLKGTLIEYFLVAVSFSLILLRTIALGYYATMLRTYIFKRSLSFEKKATHDALTGVLNRWVLDGIMNEQFSLYTRKGIPCSLAMIDIDHFKQVNDGFGHATGDQILKAIVDEIRGEIRDSDKLVRYGGEEFILIMAATSLDEATVLAERIRSRISQSKWQELLDEYVITVSIGVAGLTETDNAEDPLTRADAALYEAKQLGRNRVVP